MNLTVVVGLLLLVFVVSEHWWVSTALTYLPRAPWAIPSLALAVAGFVWHRPTLWINVIAFLMVAGPLMEFRAPGFTGPFITTTEDKTALLRVVSCNVQAYKPNFADVLREAHRFQPDLIVLQEARGDHPLLKDAFPDWHTLHFDYYFVASKYPIKELARIETQAFDRPTALLVEIETPDGPIALADIHQMTARRGLQLINKTSMVSGEAGNDVAAFQALRAAESAELRHAIETQRGDRPLVVCGDFNTPTSSTLFQEYWGDLRSCFDLAGVGYGYTSPVKTLSNWPANTPWARIDHILCSPEWSVRQCSVGHSIGSDHHLIAAEIAR